MLENQQAALFIDFDNVRYSYINTFGLEPDPLNLMEKARAYGQVAVATAYADFTEHPSAYRRSFEVAGITPRGIPKRGSQGHTSSSEMAMLMDIIELLLDKPSIGTYILMTGDRDFVPIVTRARHRFGKQVVISGVPGSVSQDLINSADTADPLMPAGIEESHLGLEGESQTMSEAGVGLVKLIHYLEQGRPYMTLNFIHSYAVSPTGRLRMGEEEAQELLDQFIEVGLLIPYEKRLADGRYVLNVRLNYDHPLCRLLGQQRRSEN